MRLAAATARTNHHILKVEVSLLPFVADPLPQLAIPLRLYWKPAPCPHLHYFYTSIHRRCRATMRARLPSSFRGGSLDLRGLCSPLPMRSGRYATGSLRGTHCLTERLLQTHRFVAHGNLGARMSALGVPLSPPSRRPPSLDSSDASVDAACCMDSAVGQCIMKDARARCWAVYGPLELEQLNFQVEPPTSLL
jgi:hypothetical protein